MQSEDVAVGGVVELSIDIAAAPAEIWRAITEPALSARWMGGFRLESTWTVGAALAIAGRLQGREHADTGRILAVSPPTFVKFEHWSRLWRVPDEPTNRAVMTISLTSEGEATRVSLRHELPAVVAIVPHSRFFWSVSLEQLRKLMAILADE